MILRARIKTKPLEQWNIGREYRRGLKKAFEAHAIEIHFPHRTLSMGEASSPFKVEVVAGPGMVNPHTHSEDVSDKNAGLTQRHTKEHDFSLWCMMV